MAIPRHSVIGEGRNDENTPALSATERFPGGAEVVFNMPDLGWEGSKIPPPPQETFYKPEGGVQPPPILGGLSKPWNTPRWWQTLLARLLPPCALRPKGASGDGSDDQVREGKARSELRPCLTEPPTLPRLPSRSIGTWEVPIFLQGSWVQLEDQCPEPISGPGSARSDPSPI